MSLQIGIVGLPNVGKSTLFKALTKKPVDINNYPFCTIEPNVGIVEVPDERLGKLAEMSKSQKVVSTVIEFVDIAGLVKGASEGEGLGNKFLANIREVDAIAHVVRVFENDKITHVHNAIDPQSDIETINAELILADLDTTEKTLQRLERDVRAQQRDAAVQKQIVEELKTALESSQLAGEFLKGKTLTDPQKLIVRDMHLLSAKPILYVYNVADVDVPLAPELEEKLHVKLDIKTEEELLELSADDAAELGVSSQIANLITQGYKLLHLITFLTTGEKESRAWTVEKDSTAPQAGAAIHSDFEDRFICADIIPWDVLLEIGSWSRAREAGKVKTVGKDHIVNDGDVIEFKVG